MGSLLFIPSLLCTAVTSLYLSVHEHGQENQRLSSLPPLSSNNCSQESIHPAVQGGKRDLTESPDECQGYQLPSHPVTNPPSLREPWRMGGQLPHSFLLVFLVPGRDRCGSGSASDDWVTPRGSKGHGLLAHKEYNIPGWAKEEMLAVNGCIYILLTSFFSFLAFMAIPALVLKYLSQSAL